MFFNYCSKQIKFSRTFQDSPVYSCTIQACGNPNLTRYKIMRIFFFYLFIYLFYFFFFFFLGGGVGGGGWGGGLSARIFSINMACYIPYSK